MTTSKNDLAAIGKLITDSEERTKSELKQEITDSEERTKLELRREITDSEERTKSAITDSEERTKLELRREIIDSGTDIKAQLTAEIRSVGADVSRLTAVVLSHVQNREPWKHDKNK